MLYPYTGRAEQEIMAFLATLTYNMNVKKKDQKSSHEIFPFLASEMPEFLEDETVLKAKRIKQTISGQPVDTQLANIRLFNSKLDEQIQMEREGQNDSYVLRELYRLKFEEISDGKENS